MESGQTSEISQRMESDASPPSPNSSESFRMPSFVIQYEHYVQEVKDTEDVIEDQEPKDQVQDSIVVHKPKRNIRKPARFSDIVVVKSHLEGG